MRGRSHAPNRSNNQEYRTACADAILKSSSPRRTGGYYNPQISHIWLGDVFLVEWYVLTYRITALSIMPFAAMLPGPSGVFGLTGVWNATQKHRHRLP